jgi:hypothetical protein
MGILGIYLKKNILVTNGKELCLTIIEICTQLFNVVCFLLDNSPVSEFRCWGVTQKKTYNIWNTAKV